MLLALALYLPRMLRPVCFWPLPCRVGVSTALAHFSLKSLGMDATQLVVGGEAGALALWSLADVQRALDVSPARC